MKGILNGIQLNATKENILKYDSGQKTQVGKSTIQKVIRTVIIGKL